MKWPSLIVLVLGAAALGAAESAQPAVAATIARARAYLGTEQAIEGLQSIYYRGALVSDSETTVSIEIIFQKPYRQRIVATSSRGVEVTVLDDYDAWQRVEDAREPERGRVEVLSKDQVKRLRANTWENLAFFRGIERRGGRVEDLGEADVEGVRCHKLAFVHDEGIVFYRYFARDTGRLMWTQTEQGREIREEGELWVQGVRFPRRLVMKNKREDGRVRNIVITFEEITVNERFNEALFRLPIAELAPHRPARNAPAANR